MLAVYSSDKYLLYSHTASVGHYTDFILGSWQGKVRLMSVYLDICLRFDPPSTDLDKQHKGEIYASSEVFSNSIFQIL